MRNRRWAAISAICCATLLAACGGGADVSSDESDLSGARRNRCHADADCHNGQVCHGGKCVAPSPPDGGSTDGGGGGGCQANADCGSGRSCVSGACYLQQPQPSSCAANGHGNPGLQAVVQITSYKGLDNNKLHELASGTPVYVSPGYLLFGRKGRIVAQRFDASSRKLQGEPIVLRDEPKESDYLGSPPFSASEQGTLAYFSQQAAPFELRWFDRSGKLLARVPAPAGSYENVSLSPDGTHALVVLRESTDESDLWMIDLARGSTTRFTDGPGRVDRPAWSPDGSQIAFSSNRNGRWDVFVKPSDGSAREDAIMTAGSLIKYVSDWSPDGQTLLVETLAEKTGWDLWQVPLTAPHTPTPYLVTPFDELRGAIAPGGRWCAYQSNESGHITSYVQSYPRAGNKRQLSTEFGGLVRWRADGRELEIGTPSGMRYLDFDATSGAVGNSFAEFPRPALNTPALAYKRDLSGGIALVPPGNLAISNDLTVVLNWRAELAKR